MTDETRPTPEDTPSFTDALEELEQILQRIEGEETDIDALASELKRAAELLDLARGKLRKAEVEVTQIVQSLDGEDEDGDELDQEGEEDDEEIEDEEGEENGEDEIPF